MSKKPKSSQIYSHAADIIGNNEYLISKILPCLPVRSLFRFQVVSKQWYSLISDPRFGLKHTLENSVSRIPSGLYFHNSLTGTKNLVRRAGRFDSVCFSKCGGKLPSLTDPVTVALTDDVPVKIRKLFPSGISMTIVQSCNGLVLFEYKSFDDSIQLYCVRNLATKQKRFIPLPSLEDARPDEYGSTCFLAFDPLVSPHYKIVSMTYYYCGRSRGSKFFVFSSETGQWKNTNVTTEKPMMEDAKGFYCRGSIYWMNQDTYGWFSDCYCFDVEDENLMVISMPRKPQTADSMSSYLRYFGEFNGHLNVVYVRTTSAKKFNVMELDQVTKKWFIRHRVHINRLISSFPEIVVEGENKVSEYAFSILSVKTGEKEKESALIMLIPGKIISYNFSSKKVDVLHEFPQNKIKLEFDYDSAYPFAPTLYPLYE